MPAHSAVPKTARGPASPSALLTPVLLLLLGASPALATTYYVSTTGNDANAGTSSSAPWRSLAKANATLVAGDVVRISDGAYTDLIQPVNNGSSSARISYVGNLANPGAVTTPSIYVNKAWVSVKGAAATSNFQLYYTSETAKAWHDSIAYCRIPGCTIWGAQDCMVARCTVNGETAILQDKGYAGPPDPATSSPARDTLRENVFNATINAKGFALRGDGQYILVERNTFNFFFDVAHGGDCQGRYLYNAQNNTFRDNRWNIESNGNLAGGAQYTGFALRDSTRNNLFERDTMYCGVTSGMEIGGRLVNSGNSAWVGQCTGNHWKDCVFKTTGYVFNQDLLNNAIIEGCVFASAHNYALWLLGPVQNTIFRNNTFAGWQAPPIKVEGDIRLGGNQFTSNIFYANNVGACYSGRPVLFHGWSTGFTEDYNLFFAPTADAGVTASAQAVYWSSSACSPVGPGTAWAAATGNDTHSKWGSPQFVNSTWAGFNAHLQSGSAAIGVAQGGGDAGAYPFGTGGGGDTTPPSTVTNLAVVQRSNDYALVSWTAPGDNGATVTQYDLRFSTQAITSANFSSATAVGTQPGIQSPGSAQSYAFTGLTASTAYYFAIKSVDAAGNWSLISNVPTTTTTATDQLAPARISDFR